MAAHTRVPARFRKAVFERAGRCCEYCRCPEALSPSPYDAEHIIPRAHGGRTTLENLACACHGCNLLKSDLRQCWDEVSRSEVSLFHPRKDQWHDHFAWSANGQEIIPLTTIGRVTVLSLQLNRSGLKNLRRLARRAGMPISG